MLNRRQVVGTGVGLALLSRSRGTHAAANVGVQRIYNFNAGDGVAGDISMWSPGVDIGKPRDFANSCYLIRHAQGWMMWDTGLTDALAAKPDGDPSDDPRFVHWWLKKTLAGQLAEVGVRPSEIAIVGISHTHTDHIGNVELFPRATLLVQRAEVNWAAPGTFRPDHPMLQLDGGHDVFGDGTITMISTPGHTPGHQSLLVRLPQTGPVLLSGDVVHFQGNWDYRRVPDWSVDVPKTYASMDRVAELLRTEGAQMWINHDKPQRDRMTLAPAFYA